MARLGELQDALERQDGWRLEQRVEDVIVRLDLPADAPSTRSRAGSVVACCWRRRWCGSPTCCCSTSRPIISTSTRSLARGRSSPSYTGACCSSPTTARSCVVATRIVELDRGRLRILPRRLRRLPASARRSARRGSSRERKFDKFSPQEEAWIRQGIKARRTRNEGRVRALERCARARGSGATGRARCSCSSMPASASGSWWSRRGVSIASATARSSRDFSRRIMRGDRVGSSARTARARPRCCSCCSASWRRMRAKSASAPTRGRLLRPDARTARPGPPSSRRSPTGRMVDVDGERAHVIGYLADFLFPPRARPVAGASPLGRRA